MLGGDASHARGVGMRPVNVGSFDECRVGMRPVKVVGGMRAVNGGALDECWVGMRPVQVGWGCVP